jgi:hypothetical protein
LVETTTLMQMKETKGGADSPEIIGQSHNPHAKSNRALPQCLIPTGNQTADPVNKADGVNIHRIMTFSLVKTTSLMQMKETVADRWHRLS